MRESGANQIMEFGEARFDVFAYFMEAYEWCVPYGLQYVVIYLHH